MKNKTVILLATWVMISLAYIIISFIQPTVQSISDSTWATVNASSNLSNYAGTGESIQLFPFFMWFVPGTIGIVTTVIVLRKD